MLCFVTGHATHPDWRMGLSMAMAQVESLREKKELQPQELSLCWIYVTEPYRHHLSSILEALRATWPATDWVGAVAGAVSASGVEYVDEPAIVLMISNLPRDQYQVFSGRQPLGTFAAHVAQVHADGATPELNEVIEDLSERTESGYTFGGIASVRASTSAPSHIANIPLNGGVSGVAYSDQVDLLSRVTQGCQPIGPVRTITQAEDNLIYTLSDQPALDCLLSDLGLTLPDPQTPEAVEVLQQLRSTLVGLSDLGMDNQERQGQFGLDTRVRHMIGLEPFRRGLALTESVNEGMELSFCQQNVEAARRDLIRICTELREEVEGRMTQSQLMTDPDAETAPSTDTAYRMVGALYVSCSGRGGSHFGAPSAELQIVRRALGDIPLVGFFAAGEIAHRNIYGYTGILTVFVDAVPHH